MCVTLDVDLPIQDVTLISLFCEFFIIHVSACAALLWATVSDAACHGFVMDKSHDRLVFYSNAKLQMLISAL